MTRTPKLIASVLLVLTLASACGGGDDDGGGDTSTDNPSESSSEASGDRPSVDQISAYFLSGENMLGEVEEEQADCIAEAFHDSDVSDEWLQALVANDTAYQGSAADQKTMEAISEDWMTECLGGKMPSS